MKLANHCQCKFARAMLVLVKAYQDTKLVKSWKFLKEKCEDVAIIVQAKQANPIYPNHEKPLGLKPNILCSFIELKGMKPSNIEQMKMPSM